LNSKAKLIYFPTLESKPEPRPEEPEHANPRDLATKGLTYPGPQAIVSDVPDPTNNFQTLLQPSLVKPPVIRAPIPLPNILQMADAGPLRPPEPPRPEPTVLKKDLTIPSPAQAASQRPNVVLPNSATPQVPLPEKPIEPPTPVRKELTV